MSASDRIPLLRSILTNPNDDLPRLVFADYLEDYGSGDLDAATVEFIRVSCDSKGRKRMPAAAYAWLKDNWPRLLPGFIDRNERVTAALRVSQPTAGWGAKARGQFVRTVMVLPYRYDNSDRFYYPIVFKFSRGFLAAATMASVRCFQRLVPLARNDQPLVTFPSYFGYVNSAGAKRRYSMNPLDDLKIDDPAR